MLRVVIIKPSKYGMNGFVERFRRGFMPNSTIPYIRSMTPSVINDVPIETHSIDESVQTDLDYLDLLRNPSCPTLLALVGVQSHQFHRALDLAALARANGVRHCVIGGPHPMTCDTTPLQNRGVSFALAEAEMIWPQILRDAMHGELQPIYGTDRRWAEQVHSPVLIPPSQRDLRRYIVPMLGIYPARGCPFTCNFCSVIKIAGRQIRSQSIETTIASLHKAKAAGVRLVMFTSDNFNKYAEAKELLEQMIAEDVRIPFFVQCDTQIARQEELVRLMARAGCFEIFVGVESFSRKTLLSVHKTQNQPSTYRDIVMLCRKYSIISHFSNIIGFPDDTRDSIRQNLNTLRELHPEVASFYILVPIPGTEQYDDFLRSGYITEPNLDRFDGTTPTWRHPTLSHRELTDLLFFSYRRFYSPSRVLATSLQGFRYKSLGSLVAYLGLPVFSRFAVARGRHPLAGGIGRVYVDSWSDYRELRMKQFGVELAPLPNSLELSKADADLNLRVKIGI